MQESGFNYVCDVSVKADEFASVEISMPRVTGRPLHLSKAPGVSVEKQFRRSVFLPFLDYLKIQINERFERHRNTLWMLSSLPPQNISEPTSLPNAEKFADVYLNNISTSALQGELAVWDAKWKREKREIHSTSATQMVDNGPDVFFLNVQSHKYSGNSPLEHS